MIKNEDIDLAVPNRGSATPNSERPNRRLVNALLKALRDESVKHQQALDDLGSAAKKDAEDFATATQGEHADSALQPGDLIAAQVSVTTNTQLTASHHGAILFCKSPSQLVITAPARGDVSDGWQVTIIQAGAGRVRIDGAVLADDNHNTLTKKGSGATLLTLDSDIMASLPNDEFWLAGAMTERRADFQLPSGDPLNLPDGDTFEITW